MSALRTLVEKHYEQVKTNNFSNNLDIFSPEVETIHPGAPAMRGLDPFNAFAQVFHQAFPDGQLHLDRAVEQGDTIIVEGRFTGTHTGPMVGPTGTIPPTGKSLELPFCDLFQARDGRIVAHRVYYDQVTFMTQLGLLQAPAA